MGWSTVVLTLDPAAYRHNIPIDYELCARANGGLTVSTTGALRPLPMLAHWRRTLLGTRASARRMTQNGASRDAASTGRPGRVRQFGTTLLAFPDEEIGWLVPAVARGRRLIRQHAIDVVLSSGPPFTCHVVARALASFNRVKWVADFRDPWSRAKWSRSRAKRAHRWLEQMTIQRADAVILNTPEMLEEFSAWYGPRIAAKFHVVTNGYDAEVLAPYAFQEPPGDPPLVLTHAGTLYGARNPLPLLEALAACHRDGRIPPGALLLQIVGKVASQFDVSTAIRRLALDRSVVTIPPVPHGECLELLAASHVLVVIQPDAEMLVPAKLYEYIGLRRPILALADKGAVVRVVRDGDFGLVASPSSVDEIATALTDLYRRRDTLVQASIANPRAARFDARYQSGIMADILSTLLPGETAAGVSVPG
jgi:glycosyltransferase involved in cell wall biosynthesis